VLCTVLARCTRSHGVDASSNSGLVSLACCSAIYMTVLDLLNLAGGACMLVMLTYLKKNSRTLIWGQYRSQHGKQTLSL
jgi:hypothetical protein